MAKCLNQPARWRWSYHSPSARLLVGMGIVAVVFLVVVLLQTWHWTHEHIDVTAERQAQLAIEFDRAIRDYVRKHIRPEFASRIEPGEFIPETMSTSFISRRIFETVRESLPDSLLRFPSTNPRNPVNRATHEEEKIIRYFEQNPDARSWEGTISYGDKGERYSVRAMPYPFTKACLSCHGRPEDAPAALVERYGPVAGFGRSAGDLSLELVALPVQAYHADADSQLWQHMLVAVLVCLLFFGCIAVLVVLDVKARAQSQRQLELSNQRFNQIADQSRTVAWEIDAEGRFTYVSHAANLVWGHSPKTLLGTDSVDLHPVSGREEFRTLVRDTMAKKAPFRNLENPVETPDGRTVWVATSAFPILQSDGTLVGYRGADIDITERRQAECTLRENERKLAGIVEGLPIPAFVIDRNHHVVHWNRALEQMTGIPASDVIGTNRHWQAFYGTERPCLADLLVDGATDKIPMWYDASCEKSPLLDDAFEGTSFFENSGEAGRWLHFTATVIRGNDGQVVGAIETLQDITERKQATQAIREALHEAKRAKRKAIRMAKAAEAAHKKAMATSKMLMEETQRSRELAVQAQAACQSKSEFLANMSHEIRTPMTAILGFAESLLAETGADNASSERRYAVATIQRNGEHLLSLINDVLDLSKIEAGRLEMNTTACSPAVLLADILELMRIRAEEKQLSMTIEYDGPIPRQIQTDPLRLRQILINLVGNAIKFTESGGVRIVARLLCESDQAARLRFDIVDSGIGIAEGQIDRLFQPFTQADSSTTREFGGTGLGLTISKRFAEMLGGDITVTSVPGKGSVFSLAIETGPLDGVALIKPPTEDSLRDGRLPVAPAVTSAGRDTGLDCCVLLAEDSPDIQRLVQLMLEKAGAKVTAVGNGRLAIDAALAAKESGCSFDVILMDMQMPVMDGYLATRELREHGYTGAIVALTAHAMSEDRQKCLDAGCDDYTSKPIDRTRLLAMVAAHAQTAGSTA